MTKTCLNCIISCVPQKTANNITINIYVKECKHLTAISDKKSETVYQACILGNHLFFLRW